MCIRDRYQDLIDGKTLTEQADEATGITQRVVIEYRAPSRSKEDLRPRLTLPDADSGEAGRYMLTVGTTLSIEDGQQVSAGDVLARVSREAAKTRDITGGLPRVAELFEARKPKENAIIAKVSGRVVFGKDYKAKRKIGIQPEDGGEVVEYLVPKSKVIDVQEGDYVKRGDNPVSYTHLDVYKRQRQGNAVIGSEHRAEEHRRERRPGRSRGMMERALSGTCLLYTSRCV